MQWFDLIYDRFHEAYSAGGNPVVVLMLAALILWLLIIERYLYFICNHRHAQTQYLHLWQRIHCMPISAKQFIRSRYLSAYRIQNEAGIGWIVLLTKVSLLLGLLGTVLALISVFEAQLLTTPASKPQMAGNIVRAIIPTAAALLVSLPGLFFAHHLRNLANRSVSRLATLLD